MNKKTIGKQTYMKWVVVGLLILATILSMFVLAKAAGDPSRHLKTLNALDEKKATVLGLTGAVTAAATAIAAVPGDATTPVADKLADLTSYLLIVLAALYIEGYLVTLAGYAAFLILLPVAFVLTIVGVLRERGALIAHAAKIGLIGVVLFALIPMSVAVSDLIERTSESSIAGAMDEAREITGEIQENTDEDGNFFSKAVDKIKGGVSGIVEKGEDLLNKFIETIAVMLVTSCGIPIVVLLFAVWLLKMLLGTPGGASPAWQDRIFKREPRHKATEE